MISPKGLKEFKERASKLLIIVIGLCDHYDTTELTVVQTLVQNAAFDGSHCINTNHEQDVVEVIRIIRILNNMADFNKHPVIAYVHEQLDLDFKGIEYSESENEFEPTY